MQSNTATLCHGNVAAAKGASERWFVKSANTAIVPSTIGICRLLRNPHAFSCSIDAARFWWVQPTQSDLCKKQRALAEAWAAYCSGGAEIIEFPAEVRSA